jgi:hypothetical protein
LKKEFIIQTGLDGFVMLDRLLEVDVSNITGIRIFSHAPIYTGLEALAQLGAYHIRHLTGFSRHVFLIKIAHCCLPPEKVLEGEYVLSGDLISQSDTSFCYQLKADKKGKTLMEGEFIFSSIDYDHNFKKDTLQSHYAEVFSCLQRDIKAG